MATQNVISFRENFHTSEFPVEAVYYQHVGGGRCNHTSKIIYSLEELHDFQFELADRKSYGEWMFVAYFAYDDTGNQL